MLSIPKRPVREIVISEPDLQVALTHLQGLPFSKTKGMPDQWGREWVLQCLREALEQLPKGAIGERSCVQFGPSLWALVVPFGIDLAGADHQDGRLQVWVLTRPVGTDPLTITSV
jgi:hypothetical protein